MTEIYASSSPSGESGYRCAGCGMWVYNNSLHSCSSWQQPITNWQNPSVLIDQRMLVVLERIATALEKLVDEDKS